MPYLTGGPAYGRMKSSASFSCLGLRRFGGTAVATAVSQGDTKTGWTLAGADYALTQHLSVR